MSKVVKKFVSRDIANRLNGVSDAVVADIGGLTGNDNYSLRKALREQGIGVLVVKRTMAARATEGTNLRPAFENIAGNIAVVYGAEDFVSLARTVSKLANSGQFAKFEVKGGVMDGEALSADQVKAVSKWPSRQEQISMLVGQILAPGATLSGQLVGPARKIAGQVKKMIEDQEGAGE